MQLLEAITVICSVKHESLGIYTELREGTN